jgi:type IV secretory pathway protease TraF
MIARARTLAIMLIGVSATVSPGPADRPPWLIWNASASVPIGLYAIHTVGAQRIGGLVVVKPPEPLASFLADRGYLPRGVPLVKHVAALPDSRSVATGSQSALAPSRSAKRASATAAAVRCPSGRAAASSPRAKSSS